MRYGREIVRVSLADVCTGFQALLLALHAAERHTKIVAVLLVAAAASIRWIISL